MTIDDLKALDTEKAASFYEDSPDGQWDKWAAIFLRLAPEILALVEAAEEIAALPCEICHDCPPCIAGKALDAFKAKLEAL